MSVYFLFLTIVIEYEYDSSENRRQLHINKYDSQVMISN